MKELSKEMLLARAASAKTVADMWMSQLQQVYELVLPNKAEFAIFRRIEGGPRTQYVFDCTAITALKRWAANMQSMLMPNTNYWAKFRPGSKVLAPNSGISPQDAQIECDKWQKDFFTSLNKSNFNNAVFQSILEMGISTGVMLLQPGTKTDPFNFKAVPLHQVAIEQGANDTVETVFRKYRMRAKQVYQTWPDGNYTDGQLAIFNGPANDELELLEGCVYEPQLDGKKKYCFFVMMEGFENFIVKEYRTWSPWIVFRSSVYAAESFGRGPILDLLPFIRELNQLAQYDLQAASFAANPIFLVAAGSEINPYTARISPGAIIPVQQTTPGMAPISQLTIQGTPGYSQLTRAELVAAVHDTMNTNPIVPNTSADKTATEVQARQAEWLRQNQSTAARLEKELCRQVVQKCWHIMHSFGLVPYPYINDVDIAVEFESTIKDIQGLNEVNKAVQASQMITQILGPQAATAAFVQGYKVEDVATYVLEKLDVNPKIIRDAASRQKIMQAAAQQNQVTQAQQGAVKAQANQLQDQAQDNTEAQGQI